VIDARELFDGDAEGREVRAGAAVFLGERKTEQPELPHASHDVDREHVVPVPPLGVRGDLRLGELTDDLSQRLLLVAQFEPGRHGSPIVGCRRG